MTRGGESSAPSAERDSSASRRGSCTVPVTDGDPIGSRPACEPGGRARSSGSIQTFWGESRFPWSSIRSRRGLVRRLNREVLKVYPVSREPPARVDPEPEGPGAKRQQEEDPGRDRRPEGQGRRDLEEAEGPAIRVRAPGLGGADEGHEAEPYLRADGQQDEGHRRRGLPSPRRERRGHPEGRPRVLRAGFQRG